MIGYLIDMDGVIYRGGHLIPGADRFVNGLREANTPFLFLTNNSQPTPPRNVATRLQRLGIDVTEHHIFTCAQATARFLSQQKPHGTAFVIGEGGLLTPLHENGYSIVDEDSGFCGRRRRTHREAGKSWNGARVVMDRAELVATNLDPNCPTRNGVRPGCGATVAMLETASGLKAFSVGKPSPVMLRAARKELALPTDQTVVIGDTMETNILGSMQLNYKTILVLTGSTRREDVARFAYRPDLIVESIADLEHAASNASSGPPRCRRPATFGPDFHPSHRPRRKPAVAGAF